MLSSLTGSPVFILNCLACFTGPAVEAVGADVQGRLTPPGRPKETSLLARRFRPAAPMTFFLLALGICLLVAGAEGLVRGASQIATGLGISPLVVGLRVVALGTSAPEPAVSMRSSPVGQTELALGNVVGSNIFNVLFILGLTALIAPLAVSAQPVHLDVPLGIGAAGMLLLAMDGPVGRGAGLCWSTGSSPARSYLSSSPGRGPRKTSGWRGRRLGPRCLRASDIGASIEHRGIGRTCPARAWGPLDRERRRCHCSAPRRE